MAASKAHSIRLLSVASILSLWFVVAPGQGDDNVLDKQWAQYQAAVPKTIVELQPFRRTQLVAIDNGHGRHGTATLINLNPNVNAWWLLTLQWSDADAVSYHLENPEPNAQTISLDAAYPHGLKISSKHKTETCELWPVNALENAERSRQAYAPLCGERVYLRNKVVGTYTQIESITNFLRDHVWGGERIVRFVREQLFRDAFEQKPSEVTHDTAEPLSAEGAPRMALISEDARSQRITSPVLGIHLQQSGLAPGRWYAVPDANGIFLSVIQPDLIDANILRERRNTVNQLDSIEADALDYLVAFDLAQFEVGFALGTDHPRVGWSERALPSMRNEALPGPDGIGNVAPLVVDGMLSPVAVSRAAATFAGGFKREHGAFRYGPLALEHSGTHYGFIEQGTVFSKLQPGLSTLYVLDDGTVNLKTWSASDDALLAHIRFARQNGVPLIEYDASSEQSQPGAFVNRWGPGNWSGSSNEELRTLRSGACLQQTSTRRFLIYGYFSTATPSAMAKVFQAYGCRYAMHLDMNALEHTYLALYTHRDGDIVVQHLMQGMAEVDRKGGKQLAPRFLSFPDDRDFFYLLRKEQ